SVSPLIQNTGKTFLSVPIQREVHIAAARDYLAAGTIGPNAAFQACFHLHSGEDWIELALTYAQLLLSVKEQGIARAITWSSAFFKVGNDWPNDVVEPLRIMIRTLQIDVARLRGGTTRELEDDREQLIASADRSPEVLVSIGMARIQSVAMRQDLPPAVLAAR